MRRPSEDRAQPSSNTPAAVETILVRGVRVEIKVYDEGLEEPDRALLVDDFPAPFIAAGRAIRDEVERTVHACVGGILTRFFVARPVELDREPRTPREVRYERLRDGTGTPMDAMLEGATLTRAGEPAVVPGGYGKAPW